MRATSPLGAVALAAVLCGVLSVSRPALSSEEAQAPGAGPVVTYGQFVTAKPGELAGSVLYTDAKTPATEVAVRVWCAEQGKFTQETATDDKGAYKLSELKTGRYLVVFADRVFVDLRVDEGAASPVEALNVIIPRGEAAFAQMAPERRAAALALLAADDAEDENEGERGPLGTLVIVGVGTATAVGAVVVTGELNDDDDDYEWVSP